MQVTSTQPPKKDNTVKISAGVGAAYAVVSSPFSTNYLIKNKQNDLDILKDVEQIAVGQRLDFIKNKYPKYHKILEADENAQKRLAKFLNKFLKNDELNSVNFSLKKMIESNSLSDLISSSQESLKYFKSNKTKLIVRDMVITGILFAALGAGVGFVIKGVKKLFSSKDNSLPKKEDSKVPNEILKDSSSTAATQNDPFKNFRK